MPLAMDYQPSTQHHQEEIIGEKSKVPQKRIKIGRRKLLSQTSASSDVGSVQSKSSVVSSVPTHSSGILRGASPMKGPSRYLKIKTSCGSREAAQVESQSRLIMESLRQDRPRVQSPGKSQSPRRPAGFLHGIREEFSPSPVVRAAPSSVRQIAVKKAPSPTGVVQPGRAQTVVDELSPQERLSISFQPTPARFKPVEQPGEVQVEANLEQHEVEEEEEPGEEVRSTKAPSEMSEVTFKQPAIPISKPAKRKEQPVATEILESESRYLHSWIPRMKKGKLYVEGEYIDFDASRDTSTEENRRYCTSRIVSRISANRITTKKRIYVLEGPLVIKDFEQEKKSPTPLFILDKFSSGFPENWEKILNHWTKFDERNKVNISNMSLLSSTLLSNYTVMGNTITSLSNLSAINAINGSHFIQNKTASTTVNLSLCRGPVISVTSELNEKDAEEPAQVVEQGMPVVEEEEEEESGGHSVEDRREAEPTAKVAELVPEEEDSEENPGDGGEGSEEVDVENVENQVETEKPEESKFECEDCKFTAQNQVGLKIHLKSKKHAKVAALKKCETNQPSGSGAKRQKKLQPGPALAGAEDPVAKYKCLICGFNSESGEEMLSHIYDEDHPPLPRNGPNTIFCKFSSCKFATNRKPNFKIHLATAKHRNNEAAEKKIRKKSIGNKPESSVKNQGKENSNPSKVQSVNENNKKSKVKGNNKRIQSQSKQNNEHDDQENHLSAKRGRRNAQVNEKSPENDETSKQKESNETNNLNQSTFGRVRKQNKRYQRASCVYNTPPESPSQQPEQPVQVQNSPVVSLRRVVLNPFKKKAAPAPDKGAVKKPTKDLGEILKKVSANPKTVKQRIQNEEAFRNFNEDHEDDLFEEQPTAKSSSTGLLKTTTKATLLSLDPDSDSDAEISIHSARTPVTAYFGKSSLRDFETEKTPDFAQPDTPSGQRNLGFQHHAYIQKKMAEKTKADRANKKTKITSALTKVVSRSQMDNMVDQSTKVIDGMASQPVRRSLALEDEPEEDWFEEEEEDSELLPGDAAPGLIMMLKKKT